MKIEDLKNTKIYLSNEDDRVKFQEKVFKLGVEWKAGSPRIILMTEHPFFYIDGNLKLSFDRSKQAQFFLKYKDKQIFLDDVLAIEEPKEECKFKPFDKVLVRNFDDDRWKPRLFSRYDLEHDEDLTYETTDGCFRSQCIPYEGNEHLVGTCKNPNK